MPLQNRMTPFGDPIAVEARGLVYANRGCLHDRNRRITRPFGVRRWIACRLEFCGWHREPLLQPGRFTELFFLDEATAFAAGHRPCRLCRYEDYEAFAATWRRIHPGRSARADAMDDVLHAERWDRDRGEQRHHPASLDDLPDGAFIVDDGAAWLVLDSSLRRWTPAGYTERRPRRAGEEVMAITPSSLLAVIATRREPVVPFLHPSALHPRGFLHSAR